METKNKTYQDELNELCERNNGILAAEDVVQYAQNPDTLLHSKFTWDDDKASHLWRIHQARNIIRVSVLNEDHTNRTVRAFVSLMDDREEVGGGYRFITTVLNDKQMRDRMLEDAKKEMLFFSEKYGLLKELAEVFEAIQRVVKS